MNMLLDNEVNTNGELFDVTDELFNSESPQQTKREHTKTKEKNATIAKAIADNPELNCKQLKQLLRDQGLRTTTGYVRRIMDMKTSVAGPNVTQLIKVALSQNDDTLFQLRRVREQLDQHKLQLDRQEKLFRATLGGLVVLAGVISLVLVVF